MIAVKAVLWRRANRATLQTLKGESGGQYHIELVAEGAHAGQHRVGNQLRAFFASVLPDEPDWTVRVEFDIPLQPLGDGRSVPAQMLSAYYLGEKTARSSWNIPSQRPETAYPLWLPPRSWNAGAPPPDGADTVLLILDEHDRYHARWLRRGDLAHLPRRIRQEIQDNERGVWWETNTGPGVHVTDSNKPSKIMDALKARHNVLLYGPPGTGKSHLMQEVKALFSDQRLLFDPNKEFQPFSAEEDNLLVRWVTFHQAYGYEDFIVGLRPDPESEALLSLEATPGTFLELAEHARRPGCASLLLIDEINRGNVARIFGELITLLEVDKRLGEAGEETERTVSVQLPSIAPNRPMSFKLQSGADVTVPSPFTLPRNLYILASMNSVDKSVAPLDSALRRRFHLVNLGPDLDLMAKALGLEEYRRPTTLPKPLKEASEVFELALGLLDTLNEGISHCLGPEFQLGHWYLKNLPAKKGDLAGATAALCDTWNYNLFPQLEELFRGREEQLKEILRLSESGAVFWKQPPARLASLGISPLIQRDLPTKDSILITFLRKICDIKLPTATTTEDQ